MTFPDDLYLQMEKQARAKSARVREIVLEAGRPDILADYDKNMKAIQTGEYTAGSIWQSISEAQRKALIAIEAGTWAYKYATMNSLVKRDLAGWSGDTPRLTEHGLFVLRVGPKQPRI